MTWVAVTAGPPPAQDAWAQYMHRKLVPGPRCASHDARRCPVVDVTLPSLAPSSSRSDVSGLRQAPWIVDDDVADNDLHTAVMRGDPATLYRRRALFSVHGELVCKRVEGSRPGRRLNRPCKFRPVRTPFARLHPCGRESGGLRRCRVSGRPLSRAMGQPAALYGARPCLYLMLNSTTVVAVKARRLGRRVTYVWPRRRPTTPSTTLPCTMTWSSTCGLTAAVLRPLMYGCRM